MQLILLALVLLCELACTCTVLCGDGIRKIYEPLILNNQTNNQLKKVQNFKSETDDRKSKNKLKLDDVVFYKVQCKYALWTVFISDLIVLCALRCAL